VKQDNFKLKINLSTRQITTSRNLKIPNKLRLLHPRNGPLASIK